MIIPLRLDRNGYDIVLSRGCLSEADRLLKLDRRVLIVTDSGVPRKYAEEVAAKCADPHIVTVPQGEESKSFEKLEYLCRQMLNRNFSRTDCVAAVGGGVVGDLAGFAAASYMRGVDFYNIPTTVLSEVDSSIGGKVAIDLDTVKNIVGAFYQPKKVLIDPLTLSTLPRRQIANGLAEAVKMSLTFDAELFDIFENGDPLRDIDLVIEKSLKIKKNVVEQDEKEKGLRRVLNFGHTVGHGIESCCGGPGGLYHGECVALGMLPMCGPQVRERLLKVLRKLGLPTEFRGDLDAVRKAAAHDKKVSGRDITVIYVNEPGSYEMKTMPADEFGKKIMEAFAV